MTEAFGIQRTEEYCVPVGHCGTDCFFTGWSRYWSHKKSFWRRSVRYTCTNHPPESKIPHTNGLQIKIYRQRILTNILCLKGQSKVPSMWAMLFMCPFGAQYFLFCCIAFSNRRSKTKSRYYLYQRKAATQH